ncbi:hypothetical protein [Pseudooctadecabacter jejudonensis]|nr:hypothetical protein [Pseudooctadecabacter jejudonensis]
MIRHPENITLIDEKRAHRSVGRIRLEINRLARLGQCNLLISEENLIGSIRRNIREKSLYPMADERLLRFVPAFAGHTLQIGMCIRSYENFWASSLSHAVKRGARMPTKDDLDLLTTQPRRWRTLVRDIRAVFPHADIFVFPFERLANRPADVVEMFCPGTVDLMSKDTIHRNCALDVDGLNEILRLRGEAGLRGKAQMTDNRWMPFDEDQCAVLRAEYRRDLMWLEAGADGLARYIDGRTTPATRPDRAQMQPDADPLGTVLSKGQTHEFEERLG